MSTINITDTDPGEGQPLATDTFLGVYGGQSLLDLFYPVGMSVKCHDLTFDPNVSWGGVWVEDTSYNLVAYVYTKGGSGTTIQESKNISSISRSSTGVYDVIFSTPMGDANYVVSVNSEANGGGTEIVGVYQKSTASFRIDFSSYSGSLVDQAQINALVYGKLATPEYKIWKRTA